MLIGQCTCFSDYRFIHPTRLGVVVLGIIGVADADIRGKLSLTCLTTSVAIQHRGNPAWRSLQKEGWFHYLL